MSLACQVARCQVSRARDREMSPLALATTTSLARHRDTARDLEDGDDTPYEVGVFCKVSTKYRLCSRRKYLRTADMMLIKEKQYNFHLATAVHLPLHLPKSLTSGSFSCH